MNLEALIKKMKIVAQELKATKGPLELFGLFLRDDSPDLWDVVIAAQWLKANQRASFIIVADQLKSHLNDEELFSLSRIVILDHGGAALNSFLEEYENKTGLVDVHYIAEGGAVIRRAYIILARSLSASRRQKTGRSRQPKASR